MAYNNAIPASTDSLQVDQPAMLANFQAIQTLIGINHVNFNTGNQGKHNVVEFPAPTTFAGTSAGEVALFAVTSTLTGNPELAFQHQTNATAYEFTSRVANTTGWARLPSGILLKWGIATVTGLGTITFPVAATNPVFTSAFIAYAVPRAPAAITDQNKAVTVTNLTTLNLTVYASPRVTVGSATVDLNYLVIGI